MPATFEPLESRALLAVMSFTIEDNSGLDPNKYALYAMGSNFTSSGDTNYYMNSSFTFVKGAPPSNETPSYKVEESTTINVPNNADLAGMRLYFFVVPVGGVASATVGHASYGYQSQTGTVPVTFSAAPEGGETAQGYAQLIAATDPTLNVNKVGSIVVTNPGRGYTSPPTVTIPAPGAVDTVTLVHGGIGYNEGTTNFAIVGGTANAGGSATINASGSVTAVTLTNRGAGYTTVTSPQSPTISPGTGFEVDVTLIPAATATSTLFGAHGPSLPMGSEPTNPPNFPFITGIVEFTVTANANTVDLQTVDGFTLPMTITAGSSNVNVTGKQYGQPVAPPSSAVVTRAKIFDAYNTFMTAKGVAGAPYLDLVYDLPNGLVVDGQKGGILSPDLYLAAANSSTGDFENLTSPLDDVFTSQLSTLFSTAISATNPLSVQGVPFGSIAAQTYTVTYNASVDYPAPSGVPLKSGTNGTIAHPALQFTGSDKNPNGSAKNTFFIFSPIELTALEDDTGNPLTGTITAVGPGASPTTATLTLANAVPDYVQPGWFANGNGLFQGAGANQSTAITPWYVSSVSQDRKTVSLEYTDLNGPVSGTATTTTTASQYQFGKLPYISMMLTPGQMAFGNSGVFADSALQYTNNSPEQTVLGNLEYQVVAAMNRGVLFATGTTKPTTAGGTSVVWGTESGWYPLNTQPQNLFSLFMHVGEVDGTPIFFQPENAVQIQGKSGPLMGSAYGFPFDENPAATTAVPHPTQVPSKFDQNIGGAQPPGGPPPLPTDIVVTFGAWGTSEGPTVNAPATFTVPENTGVDPGSPLVWPASPTPFTDPDSQTLTVTLEVADGVINGTNDPTHTGIAVGGTATARTFTGTIANLNTYFTTKGQITYTPPVSVVGTRTLTTKAADAKNMATATSTIDIVAAELPQVSLAPTTFTIEQEGPRQVALDFTTASFTDPADLPADTVYTVKMTGSGTIQAPSAGSVTFSSLGGGVYEFAGTLTNLDAYFQTPGQILYIPPLGSRTPTSPSFHGTRQLEVTLIRPTDQAASEPVTLTIVVQPNQPPVIQAPLTFAVALNVQTPLVWPASMTPFADASAESLTVTLAVPTGMLAAASSGGVTVTGSTDIQKQFVGAVAALNAYFKAGNISYTATGTTTQSRPLTITASDGAAQSQATSTIVVHNPTPDPNGPPTINPTTVLEWATENQWFVITYDQLVAASGANDPAHRTVEFTLAAINSGTLQMNWHGMWIPAPTPKFGQAPPFLMQGGTIRWLPPANTVSATGQLAFTVGLYDLNQRSLGTSQVFIKIRE
jgi:hypothetical protein